MVVHKDIRRKKFVTTKVWDPIEVLTEEDRCLDKKNFDLDEVNRLNDWLIWKYLQWCVPRRL